MTSAPPPGQPTQPPLSLSSLATLLGNDLRWKILSLLATQGPLTVSDLSARLAVTPNAMGKQLQLIQSLGLLVREPGTCYQLAPRFRPAAGQASIDLGFGLIRLDVVAQHLH